MMDCRGTPSLKNCSVKITGSEEEVLALGHHHVVHDHGHEDTPELRELLRKDLVDAPDGD
jgi:hypothetical protein